MANQGVNQGASWAAILGDRKIWVRDIAFTAVTSLVFTLLAPFGTDRVPFELRLVQNFAVGFASFMMLWPPMRLALSWGARAGLPELFILVTGLAILTAPVSLLGAVVISPFIRGVAPRSPISIYLMVLAMVMPLGIAYLMVERRLFDRPRPAPDAPREPAAALPKLVARLPGRLGGEILAVQAEDHYVRVHTRLGSDLVLMRFSDAVDELEGLEGERVHRSWWAARAAVEAIQAHGRRLTLTLANGLEVPVTREAAARLRREGWLKR